MGKKRKGKIQRGEEGVGDGTEVVDGPKQTTHTVEAMGPGSGEGGKKKSRRKKDFVDDYDDDMSLLVSEMGLDDPEKTNKCTPSMEPVSETGAAVASMVSGPLDKCAEEMSMDRKKQVTKESLSEPSLSSGNISIGKEKSKVTVINKDIEEEVSGAVNMEEKMEEERPDAEEEKKKKKKKKKKPSEEEKKAKGPSKAALSKIKKMQAALEEEKQRREQEALAAQRAEEERERARLEQLRLEKERKERQKQKEKDRKQRRKLEGKPVTKKEREAEARRLAHLAALQEQGITVPDKVVTTGEKKKVLYGRRYRTKKDKSNGEEITAEENIEEDNAGGSEMEEDEAVANEQPGKEGVESWEDLDMTEGEEEEEEEEEEEKDETTVPVSTSSEDLIDNVPLMTKEDVGAESDYSSSSASSSEEDNNEALSPFQKAKLRIQNRRVRHKGERNADTLRSPVVCVLGHVDTGKTKILDKIRRTNVQDGEAGGITQQIGATFVPVEAIREQTKMLKEFSKGDISLPGLLIIDTPGHESFSNLRTRGSSMCDLAILVVDIMHGLEAQTLESLNLLQKGKTPFIVALNKIDRLYEWHRNPGAGVRDTLKRQKPNTRSEFDERITDVSIQFAEQGLNVALFWDKVDFSDYIPLVPTSAITGDGMGDLIALLVEYSQRHLLDMLMLSMELEALVMEVKVIPGLGTTIDVILRNGVLKEGDMLVLTSSEGPFVVTVRALLMPQPLKELRVKNAYVNHAAVMAAQGVKVIAKGELEKTLPGTSILVAKRPDELDVLKEEATISMKNILNAIKLHERGVHVQASTLGSLEALLEFLKQSKIPYSGVSIGPVHKKDVMKASVMLEHDPQWAVILAFDVRVERDAQEMADSLNVRIFSADIIYHLFDAFLRHREELRERNRQQYQNIAVFPCKLRILPNCIFNSRDPIVVGVVVEAGLIKPGTPLTVPSKNFTDIGVATSLEVNHKPVDICRKGAEVCVKIEPVGGEAPRLYGRHFDHTDLIVSKISRESIDAVKNYFREDLHKSDWQLMIDLKKMFQIM